MTNEAPTVDYAALLTAERESLAHQLEELGFGTSSETGPSYDANFADTSQVTAERGETDALVKELRSALHDVDHAISKLGDASYGTCERCGQPITEARLEAMLATTLCITCASKQH